MSPLSIFYIAVVLALLCVYVPLTAAQPGFISIDCGLSTGSYTDNVGISWVPDTGYTNTGQNYEIVGSSDGIYLQSLRYFPENRTKNCYVLPATPNNTYMLRTSFLYGDFLGTGAPLPSFYLEIEALRAAEISITATATFTYYEAYFSATRDTINVCLARIIGDPFISTLELRHLETGMYPIVQQGSYLFNVYRANLGSPTSFVRYPDDVYDRLWFNSVPGLLSPNSKLAISTTNPPYVSSQAVPDLVPALVMQTAQSWPRGQSLNITTSYLVGSSMSLMYYVAFYFAEIDPQARNETRVFDLVMKQGSFQEGMPNISVVSLAGGMDIATEVVFENMTFSDTGTIQLLPHADSQLGPILNAFELFQLIPTTPNRTLISDALAIESLKKALNLTSWLGDPCVPTAYDWITCTNETIPRVETLKLSGYNLTGTIPAVLSNLTALTQLWLDHNSLHGPIPNFSDLINLQSLRLQNNNIIGDIPDWLASLSSLKELLLSNNNLTGWIPSALLNNRNLTFQDFGNPQLCNVTSICLSAPTPAPTTLPTPINNTTHQSNNVSVIVGGVVGGLFVATAISLILIYIFCYKRTSKKRGGHSTRSRGGPVLGRAQALEMQDGVNVTQDYSIAQVMAMTNNFKSSVLGEGSFGTVYYGQLPSGQEVAVKRSSPNSQQGAKEFFNEVDLLSRLHHKNLVTLVGYCQEGEEQILIYEYLPHGTIRGSLYGTEKAHKNPISWRTRLDIVLNAAEGLEYLHTGCVPSIIHRDVKTSNILLSANMIAKVADFGLSKVIVDRGVSHVSTVVKGTTGYLDPEYYTSQKLTEKSDVYSFGIVLLELICGRQPIDTTLDDRREWNITEWVRQQIEAGAIHNIIDKAMGENYNLESIWKVAELAMMSVSATGKNRPTMRQVVNDLRKAIEMETKMQQSSPYDVSSSSVHSDHPSFPSPIAVRPPPGLTTTTMATRAHPHQSSNSAHVRYMSSNSETDNFQSNFPSSSGPDIMPTPYAR